MPSKANNVRLTRVAAAVAVLLAGAAPAHPARADSLLASDTNLFSGSQTADFSVNAPGAGDLIVSITSINVGSWLDADLTLSVDTSSSLLQSASNVTTSELLPAIPVSGPETLFLNVLGTATGSLGMGLYSVNVVFQPSTVPLPSSAWLLLAGLAGTGGMLRFKASVPQAA
jgi:hypothetical protein